MVGVTGALIGAGLCCTFPVKKSLRGLGSTSLALTGLTGVLTGASVEGTFPVKKGLILKGVSGVGLGLTGAWNNPLEGSGTCLALTGLTGAWTIAVVGGNFLIKKSIKGFCSKGPYLLFKACLSSHPFC